MDDRNGYDSMTYADDEVNEFDLLLEDDDDLYPPHADEPRSGSTGSQRVVTPRRSGGGLADRLRPRRSGPYRPARLNVHPNWSRIAAAAFVAAVVLFIVWFAVSSILDHRKQSAYRAYFDDAAQLMTQSTAEGQELQNLLNSNGSVDRTSVVSRIDKLAGQADKLTAEARKLNPPGAMTDTNEWLVTTLEYRHNGLVRLRTAMTSALSAKSDSAAAAPVVAAMQRLAASDVIYADSFQNGARQVLTDQDVSGVRVPDSVMVKDPEATSVKNETLVLERLRVGAAAPVGKNGKVPQAHDGKLHGGQLGAVTMIPSGQTLTAGGTTEVSGSDQLAFEVTFQNQGEVQETNVPVRITLTGDHADTITLSGKIDSVDPGATASVKVPMTDTPQFGLVYKANVMVGPVPGEKTVDNNAATFEVLFKL